jgi:hypothetical protein
MEKKQQPIITLEFSLPNEELIIFPIADQGPCDVNFISPVAEKSNESYDYSGRHDQGKLPILKSEGPMANVVRAMQEAKKVSDGFLSERINQVYGYANPKQSKMDEVDIQEEDADADDKNEEDSVEKTKIKKKMKIEKKEEIQTKEG